VRSPLLAELVDKAWLGRRPTELSPRLERCRALIEQQHFGEVVADPVAGLVLGSGDRSRRPDRDGGRLGQLVNELPKMPRAAAWAHRSRHGSLVE